MFFFALFIYFLSSPGATPYDYFTRLAASMLEGKINLSENPPWLNELIPINGKYFVPYPPMPAIVSALPVFVFGKLWQQQFLAHILGAGTITLAYITSFRIRRNKQISLWVYLFTGFGTVLWFLSSVGSSWYLGQVSAAFFLMLGIGEYFHKKRAFIIGVFLGAAYLSRIHTVFSVLFFVYLLRNKKETLKIFMGMLPFFVFNALYNFARFGEFWDKGYVLIPGVLDEPWYALGIIHPSYISRHLEVIFAALPTAIDKFPYLLPSLGGLAVWITSPAIIFIFKSPLKKPVVHTSLLVAALIAAPVLMHGTTGFAQFGYRFIVDFLPFLIIPLIYALPEKLRAWHWTLLAVSVAVNLWGVVFINIIGLI